MPPVPEATTEGRQRRPEITQGQACGALKATFKILGFYSV